MANKPALCRADQSSSFGHLRPSPRTEITNTPSRTVQESCQATALFARAAALDKALDMWYTIGVGLKETQQTGTNYDND